MFKQSLERANGRWDVTQVNPKPWNVCQELCYPETWIGSQLIDAVEVGQHRFTSCHRRSLTRRYPCRRIS